MMFALGFGAGIVWGVGACFTMTMTAWLGPMWIALLVWPLLLALDAVAASDWWRRYK